MSNILLFNHLFIENVYQINFKEKNIFFQFLPKNKFEQFDWLIQKVEKIDSSQGGRNIFKPTSCKPNTLFALLRITICK